MGDEDEEARAEIKRQMADTPTRVFLASPYCATTKSLSSIYQGLRGLPPYDQPWPTQHRFSDTAIDTERFYYVLWHQATYKRRFWSRKLLIRLLEVLVLIIYSHRTEDRIMDAPYKASAMRKGGLFDQINNCQTTPGIQFAVPTLRPVPKATLYPKFEWLLDKLLQSDHPIERNSRAPTEFLQYWMNFIRKQSNLPSSWFSWHNDEFPEYYEWSSEVIDDNDLRDFNINIAM